MFIWKRKYRVAREKEKHIEKLEEVLVRMRFMR